ncbi:hypothetical protein ACRB68_38480 [Actinomadura sp. RB68]|uniref:N-acetyltransferase domain-containing protein n=2 Tax=Actinomadura macrotermitis TaxID=2585200 RepID=A0A7K0BX64_9ACTN|nr:hypothetical protein [Actinomadura macrotermitis]
MPLRAGTEASFRDAVSGLVFRVAAPAEQPWLWEGFLRGALETYRHFGVESALELPRVCDGRTTSRFIVALDPGGEAVAGLRILAPYARLADVHALRAWTGRPGEDAFRDALARRLPHGIVEAKAVWVDRRARHAGLGAAVARGAAHAAWLHGVRYTLLTASAHALGRYLDVGATVAADVAPVAYPDPRYRTVPLWWDAHDHRGAVAAQKALIDDELTQLRGSR